MLRIAKAIHSGTAVHMNGLIHCSTPFSTVVLSGPAWKEVQSVEAEAKSLYDKLPDTDEAHRKFKAAAKAALEKVFY